MDVYEAVVSRVEVREYSDRRVPDEVKLKVLEAARMSPTGFNLQHWRFILVEDKDNLRRLSQEIAPDANILSISTREDIRVEMDADLSEAARLMASRNIRHLVVVDEAGALRGMISIRDIIGER